MLAIILLCVSLGLDTLAVSLALGIAGLPRSRWWLVGLTFALCEGSAPIVGMWLGAGISLHLANSAGVLAGALLLGLGVMKLRKVRHRSSGESQMVAAVKQAYGWRLLLLGLTVSVDNLAIGVSFGALAGARLLALAVIPVQCLILTIAGLSLGRRVGERLGRAAVVVAGVVLVLVGASLIVQRLWALGHPARSAPSAAVSPAATAEIRGLPDASRMAP